MNAMSCIQSTHVDDPNCEDALQKYDDPKMDRVVQPVQPHMDMKASIAGIRRHWAGLARSIGDLEDRKGTQMSIDSECAVDAEDGSSRQETESLHDAGQVGRRWWWNAWC